MIKNNLRNMTLIAILLTMGAAFVIPLHAENEKPSVEPALRVMSYNLYRGGEMRKQPLSQTVKAIQEAKADIVGVQELKSPKGDTRERLARMLGWNYTKNLKTCIMTRFEIVEDVGDGVKVKLPSGQHAYVFNFHLPSHPYQPYQLLGIRPKWHKNANNIEFIKTEAEAIDWAKRTRSKYIRTILKTIDSIPDKDALIFVTGDFNEPSHLDWTEAAAEAGRHPIKVAYPTSTSLAKAGFNDAWRVIYPDEMEKPGYTWSPVYAEDDPKTHWDRIDFVYYRGKDLELSDVKIVGENEEMADIVIDPYPSDHRAVVATFKLPGQSSPEKIPAPKSKEIKYKSAADQSEQPAMFYAPASETPVPLVVALHTWSGNYKQKYHKAIEQWCIQQGWAYIHPNFRGPNNRPEATGSELVVADIVSAVAYAKKTSNIDESSIFLVGTSGGGYTALVMAGHHPELWAGVSAWVPISDLAIWHAQGKHVEALVKSCGGAPGDSPAVDAEYAKRSPITYLKNARGTTLQISAGIKDRIVPVNHALLAFNEVAAADDRISEEDIRFFVEKAKVPPKLQADLSDPSYGKKQPLFRRTSGNAAVTIFDGGHELVATAATAWIQQILDEKKRPNKQDAGDAK